MSWLLYTYLGGSILTFVAALAVCRIGMDDEFDMSEDLRLSAAAALFWPAAWTALLYEVLWGSRGD